MLLIEPVEVTEANMVSSVPLQRNMLPNSRMDGAAVGLLSAGGALPAGWAFSGLAAPDIEVVSITPEDGRPTIRVRFNGTPTAGVFLNFAGLSDIAAVNTQVWTGSAWLQVVGGGTTNIASLELRVTSIGGGNSSLNWTSTSGDLLRRSHARTMNAGTTHTRHSLFINATVGSPIDVTIKIQAPQLELAAAATAFEATPGPQTAWAPGTYALGEQRNVGRDVYEVVASPDTADDPVTGALADPPTWLRIGATNRWRMFDSVISNVTENEGGIGVTLSGEFVDSLVLFGVQGQEVQVVVDDDLDGVIYDETFPLVDDSVVFDWFTYFFESVTTQGDLVVLNLPAPGTSTLIVTVSAPASLAAVGEMVVGRARPIGDTLFGTRIGIQDFSRKERDQFGNALIVERAFARTADFPVAVRTSEINRIVSILARLRARPIVYIGDPARQETIVYGFYRDFNVLMQGPVISELNLEVEGLT